MSKSNTATMRAVVYDKPYSVSIREVQKPVIVHPDDIIVKGALIHRIHDESSKVDLVVVVA